MNKSASAVMAAWAAIVAADGAYAGVTTDNGPVDPEALGPDQLPYLTILNPESDVELLDWQQRETTLTWTAWLVTRGQTAAQLISMVEAVEDLSESAWTLSGNVRWWHVTHWALYYVKADDDLRMAVMTIETNRIEP